MAYITCDNVAFGYEGNIVASKMSFQVQKEDFLCIVGENGAGKSTLVKTLLHLLEPISGKIVTDDGLLQTEVQRDFPASVMEIVLSGMLARCGRKPFYTKNDKEIAKKNMEKMQIWQLRKKCYRNLSGGQQQRVLLARALCAATKVLLLDEPVTGLDPKVTAQLYECIAQLHQEGIAIIMVTHDNQALSYATHILHIDKKSSFYGTKEAYMQSDKWNLFQVKED